MTKKTLRDIPYLFKIELKRVIPRPFTKFLKRLNKKRLVGVEIGAYQGVNSKSLIKELNIKKLYLIDPWDLYEGYKDINPFGDLFDAEEMVIHLQRKFLKEIIILKGFSCDKKVVDQIPNNLDFVYIDGNHSYEFVKKDIKVYWKKLKEGGLIGGHDFYNGFCKEHDGIIKAVVDFAHKKKVKLYVDHPDWWIVK